MKQRFILFVSTLVLSIAFGNTALAYDVEVDGIYYNIIKKTKTVEVTYKDQDVFSYSGDIKVPSSIKINETEYEVTSIGTLAFSGCKDMTSITFPNSITMIREGAFENCSGLTSITIPNSVKSIEGHAFSNCSGLTSVAIPNSVTSIEGYTFECCSSLTSITIPNSVTSIEEFTFAGCSGLTSIKIPTSVTSLGQYVFDGCSGLTSITIPNSVTSIGDFAFSGCSGLTSITIPNSVTTIGDYVIQGCSGIKNAIIVNDMFVFLPITYSGHYSIQENISKIIGGAFMDCTGLTSITIPNSVKSIGDAAFEGCIGLTSITIPNSVTSIGNKSFKNCSVLTSIIIPNSVTSIGYDAFYGCPIRKIFYDCSVNPYIDSKYFDELIIGDNPTIVYDYFKRAPLTKIVLGKKVSNIRAEAFMNSQLKEFTITSEEDIYCYPNIFGSQDLSKASLYVPEGKTKYYQTTEPWSKFGKVLTLNGDNPDEPKKCSTPTISYSDGKLHFSCDTEGSKCFYTLNCTDATLGETKADANSVALTAYYNITCYAKADGFTNSDLATAKLYWLPTDGTLETNINTAETRGVMASSSNGFVTLSGLNTNEQVSFYSADGKELGSVKAIDGTAQFAAQSGTVVVAKIGKESLKIAVK